MIQVGTLASLQIGTPHRYGTSEAISILDRPWETSFFRIPSEQPRWLYTTHLDGNKQADTENHGRPEQAVLLYAASHYPLWQAELARPDIGSGGFAENLTVEGMTEESVCIGDVYTIGDAHIQVTGPRYPCMKISRRWGIMDLKDRAAAAGRTGWYCSVLQEGLIGPEMPIGLIERPYPQWTIALINDFGHDRNKDRALAQEIASCPILQEFWARLILDRVEKA
jgi:MOSC domain-containing protein YiiM